MITAILISLLLSAFFSGMEIAFVTANKLKFEIEKEQNGLIGRIVSFFYRHPQQYITTMLVGNNIVLVVFSMQMNNLLMPIFSFMQSGALISLIISLIATLVVLFFGEYLPKTVMRNNPNGWLSSMSLILLVFYIVLYPIAWFCTLLSKLLILLTGQKVTMRPDEVTFSRADLNYLVQESIASNSEDEDAPSENEIHILQNALDFSSVKIRDCYVPRTEVVALPYDVDTPQLKATFQESGYSKIPIYKGDIDNIIGYIHCLEMFEHQDSWHDHIKSIPIVPENMAAQKLMSTFMQQKRSIAVVVDEFGGTAGIVTLEDLMEEIVGEIEDEHDSQDYMAKRLSDHELLVSARWEVEGLNQKFGLHLPEGEGYDTLAGLILEETGGFPKVNETIEAGGYKMKCIKIAENRIETVKILL